MAGGIAHDLNTVLTTIYGYCEMALESLSETSEAGRSIKKIIEATNRARQLTARLVDLSDRPAEEKQQVRVADVLSDTLSLIMPSAGDNITLSFRINSPDLTVEAMPSQLFRVFMNIAVNALQAMKNGGGSLTVTLDSVTDSEGQQPGAGRHHALIRFADTGTGMDQETASRMFEPFFTRGGNESGTGLGLAVVKEIIADMNGTVRVDTETGKGTVIDVLVPAVVFGP